MHHQKSHESANLCLRGNQGYLSLVLPLLAFAGWLTGATAEAADTLSELNRTQREAVTRICAAIQFERGPEAYRECVLAQITHVLESVDEDTAYLSTLSLDEQFSVQQACTQTGPISSTGYTECTREQVNALEQEPRPSLSTITNDERYVIAQQCFDAQANTGARAYRVCLNKALRSLDDLPLAEFSDRSATIRKNMQLECSISSANVAGYRKCLLSALGIEFESTGVEEAKEATDLTQAAVALDPLEEDATKIPPVAASATPSDQEAGQQAEITESQADMQPASMPPVNVAQPTQLQQDAESPTSASQEQSDNTVNAGDTITPRALTPDTKEPSFNWIPILSALAITLLLSGAWFARKAAGRRQPGIAAASPRTSTDSDFTTRQWPTTPNLRPASQHNRKTGEDTGSFANSSSHDASLNETYAGSLPGDHLNKGSAANHAADDAPVTTNQQQTPVDRMRFASWLNALPNDRQQEYAIELLIYWMAYADNRYDPSLKRQIFEMKDPDDHSLIKRWVFKKDAVAFTDAVRFLQDSTSIEQRTQIIDLLMALLVYENALTPIQNNLLRFLADAFGIGYNGLNRQFLKAYGHSMPALPRPDKSTWWQQLSAEDKLRWDAHAIARQPEQLRYRIALGQPLQGDLNHESVDHSYTLAMARCSPERVSKLGKRESALLSTQQEKFESTRSALLELIV